MITRQKIFLLLLLLNLVPSPSSAGISARLKAAPLKKQEVGWHETKIKEGVVRAPIYPKETTTTIKATSFKKAEVVDPRTKYRLSRSPITPFGPPSISYLDGVALNYTVSSVSSSSNSSSLLVFPFRNATLTTVTIPPIPKGINDSKTRAMKVSPPIEKSTIYLFESYVQSIEFKGVVYELGMVFSEGERIREEGDGGDGGEGLEEGSVNPEGGGFTLLFDCVDSYVEVKVDGGLSEFNESPVPPSSSPELFDVGRRASRFNATAYDNTNNTRVAWVDDGNQTTTCTKNDGVVWHVGIITTPVGCSTLRYSSTSTNNGTTTTTTTTTINNDDWHSQGLESTTLQRSSRHNAESIAHASRVKLQLEDDKAKAKVDAKFKKEKAKLDNNRYKYPIDCQKECGCGKK
jgi:hypothetical protein